VRLGTPRTIETWLVFLVGAHSVAVAVFLLFLPEWSAEFGGWGQVSPTFFARQVGVFHLVVAFGYIYEYIRYRGIGLLLIAKLMAVLFLVTWWIFSGEPVWAVPLSALGDGSMAVVVLLVHRRAEDGTR
jgi:hypothetical protein